MKIKTMARRALALAIMAVMVFPFNGGYTVSAKTIQELKNERAKLEKETENARKSLQDIKNKQTTLEEEIKVLDGVINAANAEYDQTKADLEDVSLRLSQSQKALAEAVANKEAQVDLLGKRLVFLHENGDMGYLEAILNSESFLKYIKFLITLSCVS